MPGDQRRPKVPLTKTLCQPLPGTCPLLTGSMQENLVTPFDALVAPANRLLVERNHVVSALCPSGDWALLNFPRFDD